MKSIILQYYQSTKQSEEQALALRKKQTSAEDRFWKIVRNRKLFKLKIRRQHPIGPFIADFYCNDLKLVIEIDGEIHSLPWIKKRDIEREIYFIELGLSIVRFTNEEVFSNPDMIEERLKLFMEM